MNCSPASARDALMRAFYCFQSAETFAEMFSSHIVVLLFATAII
jgi:hypothetical protein